MIHLFGPDEAIRTIYRLAAAHGSVETMPDLRSSYWMTLDKLQPGVRYPRATNLFVKDTKTEAFLARYFSTHRIAQDRGTEFTAAGVLSPAEQRLRQAAIESALKYIKVRAPKIHDLFMLVVHGIFFRFAPNSNGGSVATAIGVIWANNDPLWELEDTVEFLVHELTHQLLFLDEICHGHYQDHQVVRYRQSHVQSALLEQQRSVDKVIHSIVVLCEIILCRRQWLGDRTRPRMHANTLQLCQSAGAAITSVRALPGVLLAPRAAEILDRCSAVIADKDVAFQKSLCCQEIGDTLQNKNK